MIEIEIFVGEEKQDKETGFYYRERNQCPFGERDLKHDRCYDGNGKNRCPFFQRYIDGKIIKCKHKPKELQLEFEF